jgi:alpha-glucosidase
MEVPWGRERLRVDVLREDVIRLKISRRGVFDETPTFAVCNDGTADFDVDGTILRTAALEVDVTTLDVRRRDGTPVIESIEP